MRFFVCALLLAAAAAASAELPSGDLQTQIYQARDKVYPALVHIQPVIKDYNTGEMVKQSVIGSGVIFHQDGYVVTNYHVAGKADRIICTLYDKEQVTATYIGGDPPTDLAVLKLNLEEHKGPIHVAEFGNSDSVDVGQYVLAMGSPLALSRTVSAGVVSTKDRFFSNEVRLPSGEQTGNYNLWIQTDAAINPGNSGGPLVDMNGRVIGINSRATFFANSIGFAIPVNIVKEVTSEIIDHGAVTRSWIGVHAQALQELESYFGVNGTPGVLVSSIDAGSPAEASGLQAGDVIQTIDGQQVSARFVEELPAFYRRIAKMSPGETINMAVKRGAETKTLAVVTKPLGDLLGEDYESQDWGFTVKGITRQMRIESQLKDTLGVYVVGVKRGGPAFEGGLRPGDVIISINKEHIDNLTKFSDLYTTLKESDVEKVLLTILRGGANRLVVLKASDRRTMDTTAVEQEETMFHE